MLWKTSTHLPIPSPHLLGIFMQIKHLRHGCHVVLRKYSPCFSLPLPSSLCLISQMSGDFPIPMRRGQRVNVSYAEIPQIAQPGLSKVSVLGQLGVHFLVHRVPRYFFTFNQIFI